MHLDRPTFAQLKAAQMLVKYKWKHTLPITRAIVSNCIHFMLEFIGSSSYDALINSV